MCVVYFFSVMFVLNIVAQVGYSMFDRVENILVKLKRYFTPKILSK